MNEELAVTQCSLDAIEACLRHGRIDVQTQRDLQQAASYERERVARLQSSS